MKNIALIAYMAIIISKSLKTCLLPIWSIYKQLLVGPKLVKCECPFDSIKENAAQKYQKNR
jgi:hypothetical protein